LYEYINPETGKKAPLIADDVYEIIQEKCGILGFAVDL